MQKKGKQYKRGCLQKSVVFISNSLINYSALKSFLINEIKQFDFFLERIDNQEEAKKEEDFYSTQEKIKVKFQKLNV